MAEPTGDRPILHVLIASTRPGRVGPSVARWFDGVARAHSRFAVDLVDLVDFDLPLLDEPNHPRLAQYTKDHTKRWSASVSRADAFVFVTPEYNYGMNAALKNALDFVFVEWRHKPVGFVSYGGVSGGLRAVQMTKQVVTTLGMYPTQAAVTVPMVADHVHEGVFEANPAQDAGALAMLDELAKLTAAVKPLRE